MARGKWKNATIKGTLRQARKNIKKATYVRPENYKEGIDYRLNKNKTESQKFDISVKKTMTSLTNALKEQKILGNLNELGQQILNNPNQLKIYVEQSYRNQPINKTRTRDLSKYLTYTGKEAKMIINKKGESYINYGKDVKEMYKMAVEREIQSDKPQIRIEATSQLNYKDWTGKDLGRFTKTYSYDLSSMENFIKSLKGKQSLITLRMDLGEDRNKVLEDYGYR